MVAISSAKVVAFSREWTKALATVQKLHLKGYKMNVLRKNLTLTAGRESVR